MNENANIIHTELIVDQLYGDIKDRIIRGELKPDEKLSIRQLCEYYGVSDTPLKQALNRLVTERFVTALPRRGMRVRCITKQDIHEAIEARKMIELFAVPYAIQCIEESSTLLEALENNLAENEQLLKNSERLNHYSQEAIEELKVSQEFHRILVKCIGNSVILDAYQNIINHQYVYYQYEKEKSSKLIASLREHRLIFDALKSKDEAAAKAAIIAHLKIREEDTFSAMD